MDENYWINVQELDSKSYVCGYCGEKISSNEGYFLTDSRLSYRAPNGSGYIYICHCCNCPSFFQYGKQFPMYKVGKQFPKNIFPDEKTMLLYEEMKNCFSVSSFTSCILSARKLLMHIAVDSGADLDKSFVEYVNYLDTEGYIPRNAKKWVDIVRKKGNEANHDIVIFDEKDAKQIISFVEIIINVVYAMPYEADCYLKED